jgi:hypothetical protein
MTLAPSLAVQAVPERTPGIGRSFFASRPNDGWQVGDDDRYFPWKDIETRGFL